jgi:nucleoside 2-deoxyribosyltransferase
VNVYIAAPLFSDAERHFNEQLADSIGLAHGVFLPQRHGQLLVNLINAGIDSDDAARTIFNSDIEAIRNCHCLVAVLDGRVVDEGVAFEVGLAFAIGKLCVGLQTDPRRLMPTGNNPMIDCSLNAVVTSVQDLLLTLTRFDEMLSGTDG